MDLLNDNYSRHELGEDDTYFWSFDLDKEDFFLKQSDIWYNMQSSGYKVRVLGSEIIIPSNFYIIIGDIEGGLDCITPDEITGRQFEAFTFRSNLDAGAWSLEPIEICGYVDDHKFAFPVVNNPVPVLANPSHCLLVSGTDVYNKLKNLSLADII